MTRQRRIILDELRRTTAHPTADELFSSARRRLPSLSLATVYRTLASLHEAGLALKLDLDGERSRWDGTVEDHGHVICRSCGVVGDLPAPPVGDVLAAVTDATPFTDLTCRVELTGICPLCASKQTGSHGRRHASTGSTRRGARER